VQVEAVVPADVVAHLADRLQERQRLDVAHGAAHLGDHHVGRAAVLVGGGHGPDPGLDLVRDVRDHLHRVAQVLAAALLGDHLVVDLPRGHVRLAGQVAVEEALVVPHVQVGLGPVVGHEDLAVLERVHRSGIHVEVGVELLHHHPHPPGREQTPEAGGGEALAQ
jgi:hypothetical protein